MSVTLFRLIPLFFFDFMAKVFTVMFLNLQVIVMVNDLDFTSCMNMIAENEMFCSCI